MSFWNYRVKRKRRRWGFSTAYHGSDHHKHYGGEHRIRKKICLVLGSLMMVMALKVEFLDELWKVNGRKMRYYRTERKNKNAVKDKS